MSRKKGTAKRTAGRTATGRIRKGYKLTAGGRVVKAAPKKRRTAKRRSR